MKKLKNLAILVTILLATFATLGFGQINTAQTSGTVYDSQNLAVVGAHLLMVNEETGQRFETATNERGGYLLASLPVGRYSLSVDTAGFKPHTRTGITLIGNQEARLDIHLEIGGVSEKITVQAELSPVNTTTGTLGTLVDERRLSDMPLNGRNVLSLAQLAPGISREALDDSAPSSNQHDTTWSPERKHQWDFGPPDMFAWEGTNEKPDHSRFNPAFFKLYDGMMDALREKGIVAHIMLKVYNKKVNWPAEGSPDEERYFRYVTARYQGYSNVVWDFSKECFYEKDKVLQKRLIDMMRANDGHHRLTTAHDNDVYDWNPELNTNLDFRSDQQHTDWPAMILFDRKLRQWPVVNTEFGYERGVDDLPTYRHKHEWQELLGRAYQIYLAGGYGAYYYCNTAWDVVKVEPEPPGLARFAQLKETLSALPYWRMEPSNDLAVGGPALALPGEVYAFYADGPAITVNLRALDGPATAEWIDTWTGAREQQARVRGGVYQLQRPKAFGSAPGLLIVRAKR